MSDLPAWLAALPLIGVGLWAWRRWHYPSFWLALGFPLTALSVRASWRRVALGCGLTKKRQRWWFTTVPGAIASTGLVKVRRRFQRVAVDTKPFM
jgi:S-DNA-T family DNA segregation ATPase FtsK/SpoIIIE